MDERDLLLRNAEDTAAGLRRGAEEEATRLREAATSEGVRRVDRASEVADALRQRGACRARSILEGADRRAAEIEVRISSLEAAGEDASDMAALAIRDAEEAAAQVRGQAERDADVLRRNARDSAAALSQELAAEVVAEVVDVRRRAESDAELLRLPAARILGEAEDLRVDALADRQAARQHATELATAALLARSEPAEAREETPAPTPSARQPRPSLLRRLLPLALVVLAALALRAYVLEPFAIEGVSMVPALADGDRVVVDKLAYRLHAPDRGDIVILAGDAHGPDDVLAKRVIGLPGETVSAGSDGRIRIDGRVLDRTYLEDDPATPPFAAVQIPDRHVFVLGDNRGDSRDSRAFGSVPIDDLIGQVELVIWPPSAVGTAR